MTEKPFARFTDLVLWIAEVIPRSKQSHLAQGESP